MSADPLLLFALDALALALLCSHRSLATLGGVLAAAAVIVVGLTWLAHSG